uniref:Uncharacterized protein n=1 Tax=Siphoviridae sp. ct5jB2 TaxID=2825337 RepID=A0A8S5TTR6_9CAUD|nr:MAG TPA: hypothetical protein [Siphoviridae sp. ct5jB2]
MLVRVIYFPFLIFLSIFTFHLIYTTICYF